MWGEPIWTGNLWLNCTNVSGCVLDILMILSSSISNLRKQLSRGKQKAPKPASAALVKGLNLGHNLPVKRRAALSRAFTELERLLPYAIYNFMRSQLCMSLVQKQGICWSPKDKLFAMSVFHQSCKSYLFCHLRGHCNGACRSATSILGFIPASLTHWLLRWNTRVTKKKSASWCLMKWLWKPNISTTGRGTALMVLKSLGFMVLHSMVVITHAERYFCKVETTSWVFPCAWFC